MCRSGLLLFLLLTLSGTVITGQSPTFNMMDTTVALCKGVLLDSEAGPGGAIYGNNEDFVFTIDAGGVVTMTFSPNFCTESGIDLLTFYDGPNIASPQIGPAYSGTTAPPPIVATSGFLTIHFTSDANVAYCGWEAQWTTDVPDPIPPTIIVSGSPSCGSMEFNVQFSSNVHCDSIIADAFVVTGIGAINVVSVSPTNCVGDSTTSAHIVVDDLFDSNCPFAVDFTLNLADQCDSVWTFLLSTSGQVNTCPIEADIISTEDTVCDGVCTQLLGIVDGCLSYTYSWNQGIPGGSGPHTVCPTTTTTYTLTVVEQVTGNTSIANVTIVVVAPQLPMNDTTLCQSVSPFNIPGSPSGGYWTGSGITDTIAGVFDPDTAGPGIHNIHYTLGGVCSDSVQIEVEEIDAGVDEAACPGSTPFQASGAAPAGGVWSGSFITSAGLFDPSTSGSYTVTYSFGNCTDSKTINVDSISGPVLTDTVCQSDWYFDIPASPFGGIWDGPGIIDTLNGTFDPDEAGGGLHNLTYTLNGCSDQFQIFVKAISAGNNRSSCPTQVPFVISPAATPSGGVWDGFGITGPITGLYDPGQANNGWNITDSLTYSLPNGCVDTLVMYVVKTRITEDTLFFCESDPWIDLLASTTGRAPCCGVWTGPGVVNPGGTNYDFYPSIAGIGQHTLTYFRNDCQDSLLVIVYPDQLTASDTTVCNTSASWVIEQLPQPSYLIGPGVPDPSAGVFYPSIAGAGTHTIYYFSPAQCADSVQITIYPFQPASISGPDTLYCSNDTLVDIDLSPAGGTFSGLVDTLVNPSQLGPGVYTLIYSKGSGDCFTSDTVLFTNHPALQTVLTATDSVICGGGGSTITLVTQGGDPSSSPQFQWNNGLFPINMHAVSPTQSTTYVVTTTDGCSDPVTDSLHIGVFDDFTPTFSLSPQQCYGEPGWVSVSIPDSGQYNYLWDTNPQQSGDSIVATAGQNFSVTIVNQGSGCDYDTLIQIPSWPAITALFSTNPNDDCISFDESNVTFIDLSNNAISGEWLIDGTTIPYQSGFNPSYDVGSPGTYTAQLIVFNQGLCSDTFAIDVCILDDTPVFVPDVFSPNGDGNNDMLYVRGPGLVQMGFYVYDRWGNLVFKSSNPDIGWDGTWNGEDVPSGVYIYVLVADLNDGERIELRGDVTLVR